MRCLWVKICRADVSHVSKGVLGFRDFDSLQSNFMLSHLVTATIRRSLSGNSVVFGKIETHNRQEVKRAVIRKFQIFTTLKPQNIHNYHSPIPTPLQVILWLLHAPLLPFLFLKGYQLASTVSTWTIFATGSQVLTHWSCCWVVSRWTIPCHSSRQCRWSWKAIHSKLSNGQDNPFKIHSTELPASSHAQACLKVFAAESNIYYLIWSKHFINRQDEWIFSFRTWRSRHIPAMNKTWKRIEAQTHRNKILERKVFHVRPSQRAALPSTCRNPRIWEEFKQGLLP